MYKFLKILTFLLVFLAINVESKPEYSFKKELNLDAGGISSLYVDTGKGNLKIIGDDVENIHAIVTIRSKYYNNSDELQEAFNKRINLSLYKKNSKAILNSFTKSVNGVFDHSKNIATDIELVLPKNTKLKIGDAAGSITIENINNSIIIDDGDGTINISRIVGNILIDKGSDNISIDHIDGNILINDGSGSISISKIKGDILIDDVTGSIIINEQQGKFNLIDKISGEVIVNGKKRTK